MIGLDTSVIVRYLVGSPPDQARRATALIDGSEVLGIPIVALVETAHVLRTQYDVAREDVVNTLIDLVTLEQVSILGLPKVDTLESLVRARSIPGSPIPDAFIAATAKLAGASPIYTFDKDFQRHGAPTAMP